MDIGISFVIASLAFLILIAVTYFTKKRIKSHETRIYTYLLFASISGCIISIPVYYYVKNYQNFSFFTFFWPRLYLVYILIFAYLILTYYILIKDPDKYNIRKNKFLRAFVVYLIVGSIFVYSLPMEYYSENNIIYTYGAAINFTYIIGGSILMYMIFSVLRNIKVLKSQKFIPIITLLSLGLIAAIIQKIDPSIRLMTSVFSFVVSIMYFTIENPDVKMLQIVETAKEQAEKANQAKSDFLSAMSHEIRTPLNAIVGFSESLKEESLTPSQLEEVNDIIDASNTLLETVNGILDISKIEANKIEIINETYSTEKLFRELVKLSEARLGNEKPIEFKYHLAEDTPKYLYGDHVRIKQVILNFLTNAIKYTKRGYIEFDVRNICRGNTCRLIIKVEDSGIGIKKESIDRLFDKFDRLDNENSTIEGTGLGLAITKRLVELMHGRIIVQSIYGKGSQFTVVIDQRIVNDAIAQEVEEVKEESTTINNDLSSKKVLIVDDNLMNLKVAARLLKSYNVIIEQADSGFKCLDLIGAGNKYDLILLDDMMPKMSGKETFKKLKEDSSFNTPVVILTANAITGMKEEYLQFGFNDYLAKPIEKDELNRVIKKFLDK